MASVRGLTPEAIKALIEDSKRDYKVVRESLTTMHRRYEAFDADLDHLSRRMDNLPDELQESLDSLVNLDAVLEEAKAEVDSLRRRFPIKEVDIADGAITANKIEAGSITTLQLAAGAVTAEKIAAGAVTAKKIDSKAVTAEKLAADSVTAGSIAADSILTRHIGTEQVTAEKLKAGAVEADKIAAGAVTADSIAAGAVTADSIEAGAFRLRPNSILPDTAFGQFPKGNLTLTPKTVMPGLPSGHMTGYKSSRLGIAYIPFARPVELSPQGRYVLDLNLHYQDVDATRNGFSIALVIDKPVGADNLSVHTVARVEKASTGQRIKTRYDSTPQYSYDYDYQDLPAKPATIEFVVTTPRVQYNHTNVQIDLEFLGVEKLHTITAKGVYLNVNGENDTITRFDILEHAPTMRDVSDAQRTTQMFAESLSESVGRVSHNLTETAKELGSLRRKINTPTSFMLVHPARAKHNDVEITNQLVNGERRYVLKNDSSNSITYSSTVAASHNGSGGSDVVWSGVIAPGSYANMGPYVAGAPASAFVDPIAVESQLSKTFDFTLTADNRTYRSNGGRYNNSLAEKIYNVGDRSVLNRISLSANIVVPQVGSWGSATTVDVYFMVISKFYKTKTTDGSVEYYKHKVFTEQSQRAGSFGTHRTNVPFNLLYDGPYPKNLPNSSTDIWVQDAVEFRVYASNTNGIIYGTTVEGGITIY